MKRLKYSLLLPRKRRRSCVRPPRTSPPPAPPVGKGRSSGTDESLVWFALFMGFIYLLCLALLGHLIYSIRTSSP